MPYNRLSTAKIARAVGCHPNTVRLYEQIGFIAPVPRSPKGYRMYTQAHLDQMHLARIAMLGAWPGPAIRKSLIEIAKMTGREDYPAALKLAYSNLEIVHSEQTYADAAAGVLERWARGEIQEEENRLLWIGEVSEKLGITIDSLRNWERNGLLDVPRNPHNHYREYSSKEINRLRVIRLLRQAGYSPMAILRMLLQLDRGAKTDLRKALDTPRPDEDVYSTADRWLTTLAENENRACDIIALLEGMTARYCQE